MKIRAECAADIAAIDALTVAAFEYAAHSSHTEQFIVRDLRRAGALFLSLVAEEGGALIGHVAISPVSISHTDARWYGLGPISVAPAWQGRGVGTALMQAVLQELRASGAAGCVLLGEPGYYGRFGFKAQPELLLPGAPAEYFQALSFDGEMPRGTVNYHAAFSAQA